VVRELAPGVSFDYVQERTEARLDPAADMQEMTF
jgi:acyl CoA:acetate/3-ketoacid CoA transferase beta subunit